MADVELTIVVPEAFDVYCAKADKIFKVDSRKITNAGWANGIYRGAQENCNNAVGEIKADSVTCKEDSEAAFLYQISKFYMETWPTHGGGGFKKQDQEFIAARNKLSKVLNLKKKSDTLPDWEAVDKAAEARWGKDGPAKLRKYAKTVVKQSDGLV